MESRFTNTSNRADKFSKDKCCVYIDMKLGINLMGLFIFVDFGIFIYNLVNEIYDKDDVKSNLYPILYGICHAGMLPALYLFCMYWSKPNSIKRRKRLVTACLWVNIT